MIAARDRQTALEFKELAAALVHIRQFCVFGSRARGDSTIGSDLDIFLVVDRIDAEQREKISEAGWEIGYANGVVLSDLPYGRWAQEPLTLGRLVHRG